MKPLTNKQKAVIAQIAAKAHKAMVSVGASSDYLNNFRHEVQHEAVGKASLTQCTQADYVPLYNYFAGIAGLPKIANNTRSQKDVDIWLITDHLRRHELDLDYLADIARDKFPTFMRGYTTHDILAAIHAKLKHDQIMQLVYTINTRGRTKTGSLSADHELHHGDIVEPHSHPSTLPPDRLDDQYPSKLI